MQEQELFQSYEVKNWDFSPRIYKILAASAIFNILAILGVAQSNLLTKKGCESPLVSKVCQVIDTIYVGSTIISTPTKSDEVDYTKTELSPDDEITFVNVADKLYYPEGYFAQSNPDQVAMLNPDGSFIQTDVNGFPNIPGVNNPTISGGGNLLNTPQQLPNDNPNAVNGALPTSPLGDFSGINPTVNPKNRPTRPNFPVYKPKNQKNPTLNNQSPKLPKLKTDTTADANTKNPNTTVTPQPTPSPNSDDVAKEDNNGIFKNKKPLKDFASTAKEEVKTAKLDAPFTVTIAADLDYGDDKKTVILKNPKQIKPDPQIPNDPVMAKLAKDAILAIGDSGWLGYLKTLGVKKVVFTLSQNDTELTAKILGEQKDENTAKTTASGLNTFIQIGLKTADGDEKVLLEKARVTPEGKSIVLNFAIPKQVAQEMITRKLQEAQDKEAKPQSTAQVTETNKTAVK